MINDKVNMWFSWYVLHMTLSENEFRFEFMEKVVFLLLFREEVCCDIVYPGTIWFTFTRGRYYIVAVKVAPQSEGNVVRDCYHKIKWCNVTRDFLNHRDLIFSYIGTVIMISHASCLSV